MTAWSCFFAQRKERAQSLIAQVKPTPNEHAEKDRPEDVGEWIADAHMCSDRAAEVARQQYRAEDGSAWNQIDDRTGEFENPDTKNDALGISKLRESFDDAK